MRREHIRNFVIIAHIDHGKSTLADRFLELTKTVSAREMHEQMLDSMDLERERGITIKMAPVRMHYECGGKEYELNLIDTPGHVDFSYEVSRALAAVEGAILLVDATKGVQAQTVAHLREAKRQNLVIIPVINKIDLPVSRADEVEQEVRPLLPEAERVYRISAKTGEGVAELLRSVVERVPAPAPGMREYGRGLIFDSEYDPHKGVIAYIRVTDGSFLSGGGVMFAAQKEAVSSLEVGVFGPARAKEKELSEGSIGWIATGVKKPEVVRVGDTVVAVAPTSRMTSSTYQPLPGYAEPEPVVFASVFPAEGVDLQLLQDAFSRLKLSDWALTYEPESSDVLGRGFRCGFLGSLHLEIVLERLRREFSLDFIATTPSVGYEVVLRDGSRTVLYSSSQFPAPERIREVREPWVEATVFAPTGYLGAIMKLLHARGGVQINARYLSKAHVEVVYELPLAEIIVDFYDTLKSASSGFASLAWRAVGMRPGDFVKLSILVAGEEVEAFGAIVPRDRAHKEGSRVVQRLKESLPRGQFAVPLQAAVEGRVIARETLPALRKDVTGHLYGGDVTRKRKLLEKQKKGKKKMARTGRVKIPSDVFVKILRRSTGD